LGPAHAAAFRWVGKAADQGNEKAKDFLLRIQTAESGTSAPPSGGAGELHLLCTAKNGDTTTLDVGASQIDVQYGASHYHNGTVVSQTDDDIMAVAAGRTGLRYQTTQYVKVDDNKVQFWRRRTCAQP